MKRKLFARYLAIILVMMIAFTDSTGLIRAADPPPGEPGDVLTDPYYEGAGPPGGEPITDPTEPNADPGTEADINTDTGPNSESEKVYVGVSRIDSETNNALTGWQIKVIGENVDAYLDIDSDVCYIDVTDYVEGDYYVAEVITPYGYMKDNNILSFHINEDGSTDTEILIFSSAPAYIYIENTCFDIKSRPVIGAVYIIYNDDNSGDSSNSNSGSNSGSGSDGNSGSKEATIVSNRQAVSLAGLTPGNYTIEEVSPADKYELHGQTRTFTLNSDGTVSESIFTFVSNLNIYNRPSYGTVTESVVTEFTDTGSIHEYTAPVTGWYELEAYGAQGGGTNGGLGGYTSGRVYLQAGEMLYVGVGGRGGISGSEIKAEAAVAGQARVPASGGGLAVPYNGFDNGPWRPREDGQYYLLNGRSHNDLMANPLPNGYYEMALRVGCGHANVFNAGGANNTGIYLYTHPYYMGYDWNSGKDYIGVTSFSVWYNTPNNSLCNNCYCIVRNGGYHSSACSWGLGGTFLARDVNGKVIPAGYSCAFAGRISQPYIAPRAARPAGYAGAGGGGWNGGGNGFSTSPNYGVDGRTAYGGGGATHISKATGTINTTSARDNMLIAAGGGGGVGANGDAGGNGNSDGNNTLIGNGGAADNNGRGGGGGGWFGGIANTAANSSGNGGSGYATASVSDAVMLTAQRSGDGYAVITAPRVVENELTIINKSVYGDLLDGARYRIYGPEGTDEFDIDTIVTVTNGQIVIDIYNRDDGVYTVEEIESADKYRLNNSSQTFEILDDIVVPGTLTFTSKQIGFEISCKDTNGENRNGSQYSVNGETVTIDEDGIVMVDTTDWDDGTYIITETKAPDGCKNNVTPISEVRIEDGIVYPRIVEFVNEPFVLTIERDSYYEGLLTGGTYRVYGNGRDETVDAANNYQLSMAGWINGTYTVEEIKPPKGYKKAEEAVTFKLGSGTMEEETVTLISAPLFVFIHNYDEDGNSLYNAEYLISGEGRIEKVVVPAGVTSVMLAGWDEGDYAITEIKPAFGVRKNTEEYTFTIKGDGTVEPEDITFINNPIHIHIERTDDDGNLLPGAKYIIYNEEKEVMSFVKEVYENIHLCSYCEPIHLEAFRPVSRGGRVDGDLEQVISVTDGSYNLNLTWFADGKYYIKELSPPPGYKLDMTVRSFELYGDGDIDVNTLTFTSDSHMVQIINYREGTGDVLDGAEYVIAGQGKNETVQIKDGVFVQDLADWAFGIYEIKELMPSPGYRQNDVTSQFKLTESGLLRPMTVNIYSKPLELTIIKQDKKTQELIPGSVFRIFNVKPEGYDDDNNNAAVTNFVETVVFLDITNGKATLDLSNFKPGVYYAQESTRADYYRFDETVYEFEIFSNGTMTVDTIISQAEPPELYICRTDSETGIMLTGGKYHIKLTQPAGPVAPGEITEIVVDTDDLIYVLNLVNWADGQYSIEEINPPHGYKRDKELKYFEVNQGIVKPDTVIFGSNGHTIFVGRIDEDTGAPVDGGVYEIVYLDDPDATPIVIGANMLTDMRGFKPGRYIVRERTPPPGYMLDSTVYEFTLDDAGTLSAEGFIFKSSGIKLTIRRISLTKDAPQDGSTVAVGVREYTIDNGEQVINLAGWNNGGYTVVEIAPPSGYALDEEVYSFTIYGDGTVSTDYITLKSYAIEDPIVPLNLTYTTKDSSANRAVDGSELLYYYYKDGVPIIASDGYFGDTASTSPFKIAAVLMAAALAIAALSGALLWLIFFFLRRRTRCANCDEIVEDKDEEICPQCGHPWRERVCCD